MRNQRLGGPSVRLSALIAASAAAATGVALPHAEATVLSGMIQYSSNAMGSANGAGQWNTQAGDALPNLWVLNPYGPPGIFFVNGPADANAGISVTLTPGIYTFDIYGEPGADPNNFAAANLFFNGNTTNPGITAMRTTGVPPAGVIGSTLSSGTLALDGTPTTGAGSLTFNDGVHNVQLTEYWWAQSGTSIFVDIGSEFTETPNGVGDFVGRVELTVTAVPTPGAAIATAIGMITLGARRRR